MAAPTSSAVTREDPCPCRGCTVSREQEREKIINNLEKYIHEQDVGIEYINWALKNILNRLKENKI